MERARKLKTMTTNAKLSAESVHDESALFERLTDELRALQDGDLTVRATVGPDSANEFSASVNHSIATLQ